MDRRASALRGVDDGRVVQGRVEGQLRRQECGASKGGGGELQARALGALDRFLQPRSAAWSECRVSRGWEVSRSGGLSGKEDGERGGRWEGWEVIRDPGGWSRWGGDAREASGRGAVRVSVCGPGFAGTAVAERDKVRCRGNGLSWGRTRSWGEGAQGQGTGVSSVWSLRSPGL